jgi:hypothetical protein
MIRSAEAVPNPRLNRLLRFKSGRLVGVKATSRGKSERLTWGHLKVRPFKGKESKQGVK